MPVYVKQGGVWKEVVELKVKVSGTWRAVSGCYVKVNGVWRQVPLTLPVPAGIIVPFNSSTIPSGWTSYSISDRLILTHGSRNPKSTGGSWNVTINTTTTGAHSGSSGSSFRTRVQATTGSDYGGGTAGDHSHSATLSLIPPHVKIRFIKATQDQLYFPANTILLTYNTTPIGFSEYTTGHNRYLMGGSTSGTGGTTSISATTDSSGVHMHTGRAYYTYSYSGNAYDVAMYHTHSLSGSFEPLISRALLAAWTKIESYGPFPGAIAFWESTTPPAGWRICDGTNGTPDLRNCFIYIVSSSSQGTKTTYGTWQARINVTVGSNSWSHSHAAASISNASAAAYHGTLSVSHTHSISGADANNNLYVSYTPPYYVLVPIMYSG